MKIVVLCGGISSERDVSISSGTQVASALKSLGHQVVLIDAYFGYQGEYSNPAEIFTKPYSAVSARVGESAPDLEQVKKSRRQKNNGDIGDNLIEVCRAADIVFMAMHGETGEDGRLQALFDVMHIRYTGTGYLSSAVSMNKTVSKSLLTHAGIPVPKGITVAKGEAPVPNVGFPCVVKPCSGGSSVGTSIVLAESEYRDALALAFRYEDHVIVEQYINGRELTVGVLDGKAMPVVEIIPKCGFYDYKNKYQAGMTEEICPAAISTALTERVQRMAEKAAKALMTETYCRVDLLADGDDLYCLESNSLPGMTPTSLIPQMAAAMGMDFPALCQKILDLSMKKYEAGEEK